MYIGQNNIKIEFGTHFLHKIVNLIVMVTGDWIRITKNQLRLKMKKKDGGKRKKARHLKERAM